MLMPIAVHDVCPIQIDESIVIYATTIQITLEEHDYMSFHSDFFE